MTSRDDYRFEHVALLGNVLSALESVLLIHCTFLSHKPCCFLHDSKKQLMPPLPLPWLWYTAWSSKISKQVCFYLPVRSEHCSEQRLSKNSLLPGGIVCDSESKTLKAKTALQRGPPRYGGERRNGRTTDRPIQSNQFSSL